MSASDTAGAMGTRRPYAGPYGVRGSSGARRSRDRRRSPGSSSVSGVSRSVVGVSRSGVSRSGVGVPDDGGWFCG